MKQSDTIDVLICVHSRDREHDVLFQRALESLTRQTYCEFNTIIVLDECWEDTKSIADHYADIISIRCFERPHKQGLALAKNFGLKHSTADWIAYLDADDQWMDCKLEVQRNWLLHHPHVDFCGTQAWDLIDDHLMPNCFGCTEYLTHDQISRRLPQENVMCHGSMLIRRVALESLGGYNSDRSLLGQEDYDLWKRAVAHGFNFGKVAERLYIYSLGTSVAR